MIKINNLNKYYNKGDSSRELHVVNDVTLELPNNGLVCIFGPSGGGKTTLLNIIGGLDTANSGQIYYDDKEYKHLNEKDAMRRQEIGYVFQNYLLFNEKSVYDNLRIALEIIDIYDRNEQNKRIDYALKLVGMYKFKKKKVKNLSGGQMQRVSIARALIKKSRIIIADEPTGNIDSTNTIEVMEILKKISENTLILLVTHEENIAYHYADRIIHIEDGKVILDEENVEKRNILNDNSQAKIYLKDLNKLDGEQTIYTDNSVDLDKIVLIIKNNTIYVDTSSNVINLKETKVELIDDHYHEEIIAKPKESFDNSWYKDNFDKKNSKFSSRIRNAFKEVFNGKKGTIFQIIIFLILGMVIAFNAIALANSFGASTDNIIDIKDKYVAYNEDSYMNTAYPYNVDNNQIYKDALKEGAIIDPMIVYSLSANLGVRTNFVKNTAYQISTNLIYMLPKNIIKGSVKGANSCIISKKCADLILEKIDNRELDYDSLIGMDIDNYTISGICNDNMNAVYINPYSDVDTYGDYNDSLVGYYDYEKKHISTTYVHDLAENELLVSKTFMDRKNLSINSTINHNSKVYTIVGTYEYIDNSYHFGLLAKDQSIVYSYIFDVDTGFNNSYFQSLINYPTIYYSVNDSYILLSGTKPTNDKEILVNKYTNYDINQTINIYGNNYKVVGIYELKDEYSLGENIADVGLFLSTPDYIFNYSSNVVFSINNNSENYFKNKDYTLVTIGDYQRSVLMNNQLKSNITNVVLTIVLFLSVVLYSYLTNRSKLIHEIYTFGVYRSLGTSKKMLLGNNVLYNIVKTTFSGIIGYTIIMAGYIYVRHEFSVLIPKLSPLGILILASFWIFIYLINILAGIIPLGNLLKKTPAQINSKFDI